MIQVYAGSNLVYDSRLPGYELLDLTVHNVLNKGGTAELTMPPGHPAYNYFTSYKTLVTIYKDNRLLFRGRALYPTDDFYNRRTITCEGERCFLRDGVHRPYMYQDAPDVIFGWVLEAYNAQVDAEKRFVVGEVTVTDPNNYIRLEAEKAEQFSDTIDKLVDRCGGYIVFTTNADGQRVINWYAELTYASRQTIEFGENLIDFNRSGENTDLATVIIPYGAKNEETGQRVTIESVNDGLDYIQDYDAVALRGVIARPVYWDDVTEPANLLVKAQVYLGTARQAITSLELSAIDLSVVDKSIDSFLVGDTVYVHSAPHGVDGNFRLNERKYNLLDPSRDTIVLGKDLNTLTGADVKGDRTSRSELENIVHSIRADYQLNVAQAVQEATTTLASLIQQASDSILLEVSETYAKGDDIESLISSRITQLADSITLEFEKLQTVVDDNDENARTQLNTISTYIRFDDEGILLGQEGNDITLRVGNDRISFMDNGAEVAYITDTQLYVTDAHFLHSLQLGSFAFMPRENGNLSLIKVG